MKLYFSVFLCFFASLAQAQTITPDESTVILQAPKKIGINLNGPTYYQGGEIYKNLLWRNPGFEPDLYRDKFVAFKAGTSTTFPSPNGYDPVAPNFWAGATFRLYRGTSPRTDVCSGTIAGNTAARNNAGPVYIFSSPCSTPVQEGDVILLRQAIACTPEAVWEDAGGGWWGSVANGGKLLSECTAPYDGVQSLRMDASKAGSTAGIHGYVDTNPTDAGILFNGQYAVSGYYKTVGNPVLAVSARRLVASATGNPLSCASQTFAPAAGWTPFTLRCTAGETSSVTYGPVDVSLTVTGGAALVDNVSFQKLDTDPTNTTVFRDELLTTLKAHCAGASLTSVPCELRDWAFQNADEIQNTVKPLFERSPTLAGANYDYPPNGATGSNSVGLEEFLELCQAIDAEPYYTLPETTGPEDAAAWIEYLNGGISTPYGALRAAHGHPASWLSIFPNIHLPMGNENWNEGNTGQGLGYRPDAPDLYYDYSADTAGVWATMRSSPSWPAAGRGIDLVLNFQNGNANYGVAEAWNRAQPNSGELAPYTQGYVGDVYPLSSLWNPLFFEVANNTTNPALTFFQQGSAIKAHGKLNVYEFDNGTSAGSALLSQSVLDRFTDAAGYGTATALQALQHLAFGIVDQNFFSLDQYANYTSGLGFVHNWGAVIDMGGATNAIRPQELGMRMANAAIIGPMYACPVANPDHYDLAPNHNGSDSSGMPATKNVPLEYAFCFQSGLQRSMIVINTDVVAPHSIAFAGYQSPIGPVTLTRYAPASISATNEATANSPTNSARQNVAIDSPITLTDPVADVLPPYSITRYDWTADPSRAPAATTLTLATPAAAVTQDNFISLTAIIAPAAASGSVVFLDAGVPVATAALVNGSAGVSLPAVIPGTHTFTATYAANLSYSASTAVAVPVTVQAPVLIPTSTALAFSTKAPAGDSSLSITVSISSSASALVSGSVTLMDGSASIGTANLAAGRTSYKIASVTPGIHRYMAHFAGSKIFAASASPVIDIPASRIPTSVQVGLSSSNRPHTGNAIRLFAIMGSSADDGTVLFKDGSSTLGTANLSSGTATLLTPALTAGKHAYTALYEGTSTYAPSSSAVLSVIPTVLVPYLQTSFNEHTATDHINGTSPAVNHVKAVWTDSNGDWSFKKGGGIVTDTPDLSNPLLIDTAHTDFTATFDLSGTGVRLLFRYTNLKNNLFVVTYDGEVDLYSDIQGKTRTLATVYPASTSGPVTVTLAGSHATLSCGGKSATAAIPANLPLATRIGIEPPAAGFTIQSLSVTP